MPGSVGSQASDLRVDFQDTSSDFWRIVDRHQPQVLITTSRGGRIVWELEAVEGGHDGGTHNPADDWRSDEHGVGLPLQDTIDARSWEAISIYRKGRLLRSSLPFAAIQRQGDDVQVDEGTSGNYLSGFLGLHGLYYQSITPEVRAAGHIHVGIGVEVLRARALMEASLEATLVQAKR